MTTQVYPSTPVPAYRDILKENFKTVISEYEGENEQRQLVSRFPKRIFTLEYPGTIMASDWHLIENFFRRRKGSWEPCWYFDIAKRFWVDEYVGRGGPFYVDGAVADDGGVQTDETIYAVESTANDMTLLPAVPAQNDAYYFGKPFMFDKLTVTIGVQGAGSWTIVWEYWNGTAWVALSAISDGTSGFMAAVGDRDVTFTMPDDWVDYEVKRRNLYWIRARVSSYSSVTTQPKGSYAKVNTKTYDLHSKTTTDDASLIAYVNDVVTAKTFVSGGGGGSADRIIFADYQVAGSLITSDFYGYLRIRATIQDTLADKMVGTPEITEFETITLREIWW